MSKVSLKEQIEKVENQSLSGIYSKEDVLALLNDVKEDVAPDGGSGLKDGQVEEIIKGIKEYLKTSACGTYNAADYLEDPQFELHYGNEIGIDSVSLDGCSLIDGIADDGELVEVINASLAKAAEAQAEKDKEDDEEIVVVDVSEEESELDNELDYFAGRG